MNKLSNLTFIGTFKKIYLIFFGSLFYHYNFPNELRKMVSQFHTLLDVGCGSRSPIKDFSKNMSTVGIDAFQSSIDISKKENIHNEYFLMNMLDIEKKFKFKTFECVLLCDALEHVTFSEGEQLLKKAEAIASKRVVVFTPNGFISQNPYEENPFQIHKSGWTVNDMKKRGYSVIGINGWKPLRSEGAQIRFRPRFLWKNISLITQILFARHFPKTAFQILCFKNIEN